MLFSSTTTPGHTSAISSSLVTSWPWRLTRSSRISNARCPIITGTLWANSSRRATSNRNGPKANASLIGSLRYGYRWFDEPQGEPIAAITAFVIHVGREAAHQMNANVPDLRLLERARRNRRRRPGGIELAAVILNSGDQISAVALELDGNFERIVPCGPIHDDVGDRLFKAELHGEGHVRRRALFGEPIDPAGQALQFGNVVAQHQTTCFAVRHRNHDANAAVAAAWV